MAVPLKARPKKVQGKATTKVHSAGASGGQSDATKSSVYNNGMATFTVAKGGLMYEAIVGGARFTYEAL